MPTLALALLAWLALASPPDADGSEVPARPGEDPPACADYPDAATSPYDLPYPPGVAPPLVQGNCGCCTHRADGAHRYAFDFLMPIGTLVVAARAGVVVDLEDRFADGNGERGRHNHVHVRHSDGTIARYLHLTRGGVRVEEGAEVRQGDILGLSGHTGLSSEPHLHFEVVREVPRGDALEWVSIPVSFRNTETPTQRLTEGETYLARPAPRAWRKRGSVREPHLSK